MPTDLDKAIIARKGGVHPAALTDLSLYIIYIYIHIHNQHTVDDNTKNNDI